MRCSTMAGALIAICVVACSENNVPVSPKAVAPTFSAEDGKYAAQKLLAAIQGKTQAAAFIDQVLQDNATYEAYFSEGLGRAIQGAPINEPHFQQYRSCLDAANSLAKFAELRRIGKGQNEQSDAFRRPYWDSLAVCKRAVEATGIGLKGDTK